MIKSGYVYRYLHNGKVVYVGQTKNALHSRIKQHCKETAFLGLTTIEYIEIPFDSDRRYYLSNKRKLNSTERYYIAKYNPILNIVRDDRIDPQAVVRIEENEWKPFDFNKVLDAVTIPQFIENTNIIKIYKK